MRFEVGPIVEEDPFHSVDGGLASSLRHSIASSCSVKKKRGLLCWVDGRRNVWSSMSMKDV
jgi:hypothetical protein